jgi:hypothetical protein
MRISVFILFYLLIGLSVSGQAVWPDTLKTNVNLESFHPTKKTVQAEYGKVTMYFNQADYLKTEVAADTVRITPKYFSDKDISRLLKEGKVKIVNRSDNTIEREIVHYLKQYASMCDRIFELKNGVRFFSRLEIFGLMNVFSFEDPEINLSKDTSTVQRIAQERKNEFEYPEEFPVADDKTIVRIRDYLPCKKSAHYVYSNNNGYGEFDTNICKTRRLGKQDIFYFEECYDKNGMLSIGTTMFGYGIYFYRNDSLFTMEADYEKDIAENRIGDAGLLLPANMSIGDSAILESPDKRETFTLLAKEDIQTNTVLKDCIKFKIKTYWPGTVYIGYVWLQKGVGLVKWMRSTGRIDELTSHY